MYDLLKRIYFLIPFKHALFSILRKFYTPSSAIAKYLKFNGSFNFRFGEGLAVKIYNDDTTVASLIFWKGMDGYERESLKAWKALCKNKEVIFDVGANFGLFGLIAQRINPSAKVFFFEPIARNADRVNRNIRLNNFHSQVEASAVSNFEGEAVFYDMDSDENTIASFKKEFVEGHSHKKEIIPVKVPVITLDNFVKRNNISKIDLVKIDVEGADSEALEGFKESIQHFSPDILIEITDIESAKRISDFFDTLKHNYLFYEIDESKGFILRDKISKMNDRNFLICKEESFKNANFQLAE